MWMKLSQVRLTVDGHGALLSAGLDASVEIVTGKRGVIDFVWSLAARAVGEPRGSAYSRRGPLWSACLLLALSLLFSGTHGWGEAVKTRPLERPEVSQSFSLPCIHSNVALAVRGDVSPGGRYFATWAFCPDGNYGRDELQIVEIKTGRIVKRARAPSAPQGGTRYLNPLNREARFLDDRSVIWLTDHYDEVAHVSKVTIHRTYVDDEATKEFDVVIPGGGGARSFSVLTQGRRIVIGHNGSWAGAGLDSGVAADGRLSLLRYDAESMTLERFVQRSDLPWVSGHRPLFFLRVGWVDHDHVLVMAQGARDTADGAGVDTTYVLGVLDLRTGALAPQASGPGRDRHVWDEPTVRGGVVAYMPGGQTFQDGPFQGKVLDAALRQASDLRIVGGLVADPGAALNALALSQDGQVLSALDGRFLKLYLTRPFAEIRRYDVARYGVAQAHEVFFLPDGQSVLVVGEHRGAVLKLLSHDGGR
jgi:hypothetical protein